MRMGRGWGPRHSRWLEPEAYDALSPAEKRALWNDRKWQRRAKRSRKQSDVSGTMVAVVAAAAVCAGLSFALYDVKRLPENGATTSAGVRASFGFCHTGGGTNCVVDGDTFYLNGDKVRIVGIDAPETHDYHCQSELDLGNQATRKLHSLLGSGVITMTSIDRDRDVYGRLLRNVTVDGQDVGEAMISAGLAREYGSGRRSWC